MQIYSETSVALQSASEHQESLSESSVAVQWASGPLQTTANTQFAKPQMHILQSNRRVQSTVETSCPPCSVAVALRAIGDANDGPARCMLCIIAIQSLLGSLHRNACILGFEKSSFVVLVLPVS